MIFSQQVVMYFLSLFLVTMSLIFFVTIGGFFTAYFYKILGNSTACEDGFNSLNPLNHLNPFIILIFMTFGWFFGMKRPQLATEFYSGNREVKKIISFFGPGLFHIVLASVMLFIGVYYFSFSFSFFAIKTSLQASSNFILELVSSLKINGIKLLCAGFLLYSVSMNLVLGLFNFLFSLIDLFFKKYFSYNMSDMRFIFLFYICIYLFLLFFSKYIMYFFWKIIILPLYLLY